MSKNWYESFTGPHSTNWNRYHMNKINEIHAYPFPAD
jgi:hypothetical protein